MKSFFAKILHGFLFGIGLGIALGIASFVMMYQAEKKMENVYEEMTEPDVNAIEITKHRKVVRAERLSILAEIKNTGEESEDHIRLNVDLFLNGEFVKQCDEYLNGSVAAGETRNVEISCGGGCSKNPIVEHDSYKVYVTGL